MIIEIAGKNYKIITTDSKNIRLAVQQDTATIFAPAGIDIATLEQFIKNTKIVTPLPEEVIYSDQPLQLFQQNYLLKIIKNSTASKVLVKNRTITLHCKGSADDQKLLKVWQQQFVLQQLSDHISSWEEQLKVLVGTVKLRALTKNLYTLHQHDSITFSTSVTCLSNTDLKYLTFTAIADLFGFTPKTREAYFPNEQLLQHQIAYTLKTCQQSN